MTIAVPTIRMTVPEFLKWSGAQGDDRYELVDGKVVAMAGDSVRHNRTKSSAWRALEDAARNAGLPCRAYVDGVGVPVGERTLRIPDVMLHCGSEPAPDALTIADPILVVEVVSPSSERDDIRDKIVDYFAVDSIRHYLIVFSEKRIVLHHRRGGDGEIRTAIVHDGDLTLDPPGITVAVRDLLEPATGVANSEAPRA